MKRIAPLMLMLLMLIPCVPCSADPLALGEDLAGVLTFPAGVDPADARYVYTYRYPHAEGEEEAALAINAYYAYEVTDAEVYRVPMWGEEVPEDMTQLVDVSYEVTCSNDEYVCFLITTVDSYDGIEFTTLQAQVFARSTDKAGSIITLPYLLGILAETEEDTWLQQRQTEKADACVREMILSRIAENPDAYYEDIDDEYLAGVFYPEEDFYLDENGDPVFFLMPGDAAPEEMGPLFFPMPLEDLLDEI